MGQVGDPLAVVSCAVLAFYAVFAVPADCWCTYSRSMRKISSCFIPYSTRHAAQFGAPSVLLPLDEWGFRISEKPFEVTSHVIKGDASKRP